MAHILVIDDNEGVRAGLHALLQAYEYEVSLAASAEEAAELLAGGNAYELIICDFHMGGMNGLELFRALKSRPQFKTPFMLHTSNDSRAFIEQCRQEGCLYHRKGTFTTASTPALIIDIQKILT